METNERDLNFIDVQNGNLLSPVQQKQSSTVTPMLQSCINQEANLIRKNKLQLQQLMRKKAILKRIEEREKGAQYRLQSIKNQKQMSSTLNKKKNKNFSQEKFYYPPKINSDSLDLKNMQTQIAFKKKLYVQKENIIKVYQKTSKTNHLPKIKKQRIDVKDESICTKNEEISLVDFGIFRERKKINIFAKKIKTAIQKEFIGGIDLGNSEDLERLESLLLAEINTQQRLLLTE